MSDSVTKKYFLARHCPEIDKLDTCDLMWNMYGVVVFSIDETWVRDEFIPRVQNRGAEIIKARGLSSAASAASAAIDHMRDWSLGTEDNDWVSMAIPSDGSYGISEGIIYSFPVRCQNGSYSIVQDLEIDDFSKKCLLITEKELLEEKAAIEHLL